MATSSSTPRQEPEIRAGFIPLVDCAPLVIAREKGFDRTCGFGLRLHREVSWANIRDKVDIGAFDCAHMLAPMPLATSLGLGRATEEVLVPLALNLNGNAITVSHALSAEMTECDPVSSGQTGMGPARALAAVVEKRRCAGGEPLTLGMVFPFSSHNYDLRCWLAAAGIEPDNDVNLIVIPPPLVSESLRLGRIDGFCVGEPWNSVAAVSRHGRILATKSQLWSRSPEKVLGVRQAWARRNPQLVSDLIRAIVMACQWLDDPANRQETARILALPKYVGVAQEVLAASLNGDIGLPGKPDDEMVVFYRGHANFPWRSHAVWHLAQMIRWGQVRQPFDLRAIAERVYRPDLYRDAVRGLGIETPPTDYKREGNEETGVFFGGEVFDPERVIDYLRRLSIRSLNVDLEPFAALNR